MKRLILIAAMLINSMVAAESINSCQKEARLTLAPKATSNVSVLANLNPSSEVSQFTEGEISYNNRTSMTVYEKSGEFGFVTFFFKKREANTWDLSVRLVKENGKRFYHLNQPISFDDDGSISTGSIFEVFQDELPMGVDLSGVTHFDNNFSVTCLSQDGWSSLEPMHEKDNSLRIPVLKVSDSEYYHVDFISMEDNSFQIKNIEARDYNYNFEDEEHTPYYDMERNVAFIPLLVNSVDSKKYSVELHKNNNGSYEAFNVVQLD